MEMKADIISPVEGQFHKIYIQKLTVSQLVKKYLVFCAVRCFLAVVTNAPLLSPITAVHVTPS
jgi:hypothetical protein